MSGVAVVAIVFSVSAAPPPAEQALTYNAPKKATQEEGLVAWSRIFEVVSHPRCANCHTGPSDRPMWSGPSYGKARVHGMNVRAGASRIGAESGLMCNTCHVNSSTTGRTNDVPHAAPHVAGFWRLAPAEAEWYGRDTQFICEQMRDPKRNGGRNYKQLASHLGHDKILHWAWTPGGGRQPAPRTLQAHIDDILQWGVAGMPCPKD